MSNYLDKAARTHKAQRDGMTPGRQESLEAILDHILLHERDEISRGGVWKPSEDTRKAEELLDRLLRDILEGRGKLEDFRKGCRWWREAGTNISPGLPGI